MRKTRSKKRTKIRVWLPSSPVRSGLKGRLPLSLGPRGPESSAPFICLHPHPHTMPHQRVCPVSGCWVGAQGRSPVFWNLLSLSAPSPACPQVPGPTVLWSQLPSCSSCFRNPGLSEGEGLWELPSQPGGTVMTPLRPRGAHTQDPGGGETPETYAREQREVAASSGSSHRGSRRPHASAPSARRACQAEVPPRGAV